MSSRLPKDWIQTFNEPPYLKVKWGEIITGLIGGFIAGLGVIAANVPVALTAAIERPIDAAGEAVSMLVDAVLRSLTWLVMLGGDESLLSLPTGPVGWVIAMGVGAVTLYVVSVGVSFALGGDG